MKTKSNLGFDDVIIGAEKEMNFSIDDDNPVIFDILRNKMYSDPIGAICREVTCNARDANREVGRGDVAIDIELKVPSGIFTQSTECLIITDYGPGINPSRMEDVFVKYGSSTKRSTDAQTGGWGLGAKTPFAYTDAFTIITRCKNDQGQIISYEYSAIIDSSDKGKMIEFDRQVVEDESAVTGTSIIIPVNPEDVHHFESKIIKVTQLWDTKPNLHGFNLTYGKLEYIEQLYDDHGELKTGFIKAIERLDKLSVTNTASVIINLDGINYKLKDEYLQIDKMKPDIKEALVKDSQTIMVLYFNTGELQPSANREEIQYDKNTIQAIEDRLNWTIDQMESVVVNRLKELNKGSKLDVIKFFNVEREDQSFIDRCTFIWPTSQYISKALSFDIKKYSTLKLRNHTITIVDYDRSKRKVVYSKGSSSIASSSNLLYHTVIYRDKGRKDVRRNLSIMDHIADRQDIDRLDARFVMIEPIKQSKHDESAYYDERIKLIYDWCLDIELYDSFDKIELENDNVIKTTNYAKKRVVGVPSQWMDREMFNAKYKGLSSNNYCYQSYFQYSSTMYFNKDDGFFYDSTEIGDDCQSHPSDTVIIPVKSTSMRGNVDSQVIEKINLAFELTRCDEIILLTPKSVTNYAGKYRLIDDIIHQKLTKRKDQLVDQYAQQLCVNKLPFIMAWDKEKRFNLLQRLKHFLPFYYSQLLTSLFGNDFKPNDLDVKDVSDRINLLDFETREEIRSLAKNKAQSTKWISQQYDLLKKRDPIAADLFGGKNIEAIDQYIKLLKQVNRNNGGRKSNRVLRNAGISRQLKIK